MLSITLKTDQPEAELGIYDDAQRLGYIKWQAHRELAETIHKKIEDLLNKSSKSLKEVQGIVVYKGPGSFTGLRIGFAVANSLAYSLTIPIVSSAGASWAEDGISRLNMGENEKIAAPEYGAPVNITQPRK